MTVEPDSNYSDALALGAKVGEYRVEGLLDEGGFGAVYRATHPLIGKTAAIKVIKQEYSGHAEMVSRFVAEARAVNAIGHRNIIDIFGFGRLPDGRHYYVMELLDGVTLEAHIQTSGPLPVTEALEILRPLARALDAAHSHGIAHRDLKPENIFLADVGEPKPLVKLLDFGIAKLTGELGSQHTTQAGMPMGTPAYMSPEQVSGAAIDARTDGARPPSTVAAVDALVRAAVAGGLVGATHFPPLGADCTSGFRSPDGRRRSAADFDGFRRSAAAEITPQIDNPQPGAHVRISLQIEPNDGEIYLGNERIETNPFSLARGAEPVTVELRKNGYVITKLPLIPDRERELSVHLKKQGQRSKEYGTWD